MGGLGICCCECKTLCAEHLPETIDITVNVPNGEFATYFPITLTKVTGGNCAYVGTACAVDTMVPEGEITGGYGFPSVASPVVGVNVFPVCCSTTGATQTRTEYRIQARTAFAFKVTRWRQYRIVIEASILPDATNTNMLRLRITYRWQKYVNFNYVSEWRYSVRQYQLDVAFTAGGGGPGGETDDGGGVGGGAGSCTYTISNITDWCEYAAGALDVPYPPETDGVGSCAVTSGTPICEVLEADCYPVDYYTTCDGGILGTRVTGTIKKKRCRVSRGFGAVCTPDFGILGNCITLDSNCPMVATSPTTTTSTYNYISDPFPCEEIPSTIPLKRDPYTNIAATNIGATRDDCDVISAGGTPVNYSMSYTQHTPAIPRDITAVL